MKKVALITDGACLGTPGPGGWACILRFGDVKKEIFGFDPRTTNNRMELMAAIQGLMALKEPCEVEVTTDSEYLLYGITRWIVKWKRRHWWRNKDPIRNADLWLELDALAAQHRATWVWTRGHAGHSDNMRCDQLAGEAAARQTSSRADGRPHAPLRLNLGADYVPPKPQSSLFEDLETGGSDDQDEGYFA